MKAHILMALLLAASACDVVDPTLIGGPISPDTPPGELVNATVVVLQTNGYTLEMIDRESGVVTTAWRDESSFMGQVFLEESHRTRISVVVDFLGGNVSVQMTKQVRDGENPWRNDDLSGGDRRRVEGILAQIQERARALHDSQASRAGS